MSAKQREPALRKKRNKKVGAPVLQGGPKHMDGKEPTLKNKSLQELAKFHLRQEVATVTQISSKTRHKNSGRQVLPNDPTNPKTGDSIMSTTEHTSSATAAHTAATPGPADRMEASLGSVAASAAHTEAFLADIAARMKPEPMWQTGAKIGGGALLLFGITVAAGLTVNALTTPSAPVKKV